MRKWGSEAQVWDLMRGKGVRREMGESEAPIRLYLVCVKYWSYVIGSDEEKKYDVFNLNMMQSSAVKGRVG